MTDERVLNGCHGVSRAAAPLVELATDRAIESALVVTLLRILTMRLRERTRRLEEVELRLGALLGTEHPATTRALTGLESPASTQGNQARTRREPEADEPPAIVSILQLVP